MVSHRRRPRTCLHWLQAHHHWMHKLAQDCHSVCTMDPSAGLLCAKSFLDKINNAHFTRVSWCIQKDLVFCQEVLK